MSLQPESPSPVPLPGGAASSTAATESPVIYRWKRVAVRAIGKDGHPVLRDIFILRCGDRISFEN